MPTSVCRCLPRTLALRFLAQVGYLSRSGMVIERSVSCSEGMVRFTSRNQRDLTKRFPELSHF